MKHKTMTIIIEVRNPRTDAERECYGRTETDGHHTRVFIKAQQSTGEFINTFFHEMTHAFNYMFGFNNDTQKDEYVARLVGNVAEPCFREYKRNSTREHRRTGV